MSVIILSIIFSIRRKYYIVSYILRGTRICLLFRSRFSVVTLCLPGEVGCSDYPGQIVIVGVYPIGRVGHIQELILHAPAVILAGRDEVHF